MTSTVPARSAVIDFGAPSVSSILTSRFCFSKQPAGPATKTGRWTSDPRVTASRTSVRLDCLEDGPLPHEIERQTVSVNSSLLLNKLISKDLLLIKLG